MLNKLIKYIFISLCAFYLIACASPDDGPLLDERVYFGSLYGTNVSGLQYKTLTQSGSTDLSSRFKYKLNETVSFSIGDIQIGKVKGQFIITPISLAPAATSIQNDTVINISRFLQTLDGDLNLDNGIQLPASLNQAAKGKSVNFNQSTSQFKANTSVLISELTSGYQNPREIINSETAVAQLKVELIKKFLGYYNGATSDVKLSWVILVNPAGEIEGAHCNVKTPEDLTKVKGNIESDGQFTFSSEDSSIQFSGILDYYGRANGSWNNIAANTFGTLNGKKEFLKNCNFVPETIKEGENGSGNYGKINYTFAGVQGTNFKPTRAETNDEKNIITWTGDNIVDDIALTLTQNIEGEADKFEVLIEFKNKNIPVIQSYSIACSLAAPCESITLDSNAIIIKFDGTQLSGVGQTDETSRVSFTGELSLEVVLPETKPAEE